MSGNCYGDVWKKHVEPRIFPIHLQANGYTTFYAGKYLNEVIFFLLQDYEAITITND